MYKYKFCCRHWFAGPDTSLPRQSVRWVFWRAWIRHGAYSFEDETLFFHCQSHASKEKERKKTTEKKNNFIVISFSYKRKKKEKEEAEEEKKSQRPRGARDTHYKEAFNSWKKEEKNLNLRRRLPFRLLKRVTRTHDRSYRKRQPIPFAISSSRFFFFNIQNSLTNTRGRITFNLSPGPLCTEWCTQRELGKKERRKKNIIWFYFIYIYFLFFLIKTRM